MKIKVRSLSTNINFPLHRSGLICPWYTHGLFESICSVSLIPQVKQVNHCFEYRVCRDFKIYQYFILTSVCLRRRKFHFQATANFCISLLHNFSPIIILPSLWSILLSILFPETLEGNFSSDRNNLPSVLHKQRICPLRRETDGILSRMPYPCPTPA